ncbi:HAD family hydrolase [Streptomyces bobili]|uniref:HAD family hydrolase n=1 Tax=Streptomyces bobili TaxID=67280 RepID=UPI0037A34811
MPGAIDRSEAPCSTGHRTTPVQSIDPEGCRHETAPTLPPVVPLVPPKLIATDLGGTLLRSDGTLSDRTRAALTAAEQAGIRVVLVTGRPPRSVPELPATIGPHFVIAANGAAVYAPDGTLAHVSPIRPLAATRLITRRALPGAAFAVEHDGDFGHEPAYPTWSFGGRPPNRSAPPGNSSPVSRAGRC